MSSIEDLIYQQSNVKAYKRAIPLYELVSELEDMPRYLRDKADIEQLWQLASQFEDLLIKIVDKAVLAAIANNNSSED